MPDNIIYNKYIYISIALAVIGVLLIIYKHYFITNFIKTNAVLSGIKVESSFTRGIDNFYYDLYLYHGVYQFEYKGMTLTKEESRGTLLKKLKENMIGSSAIIYIKKDNPNKVFSKRWLDEVLIIAWIFFLLAIFAMLMAIRKIIHGY